MARIAILWSFLCMLSVFIATVDSTPVDLFISENNATIHEPGTLQKRAPVNLGNSQLKLLLNICEKLQRELDKPASKYDFVLFVGNSGSYMKECFEHKRMKAIPLSKARKYEHYEHRQDDPENEGVVNPYPSRATWLEDYYVKFLKQKFNGMRIDRFVLVDHSSSGKSVDATKKLLQDVLAAAVLSGDHPEVIAQNYYYKPFVLFNVIDKRKTTTVAPLDARIYHVADPDTVGILQRVTAGNNHEVDRLLGDEGRYFRVQCNYPASKFHLTTEQAWAETPGTNFEQAKNLRKIIRDYVKAKKGALLDGGRHLKSS